MHLYVIISLYIVSFNMLYHCGMCYFNSPQMQTLSRHIVKDHRHDPSFVANCNFEGCGVSYNSWESFKSHVRRKHREDLLAINDNLMMDDGQDDGNNHNVDLPDQHEHTHIPMNILDGMQGVELTPLERNEWNSVKFHLKLKESSNLSQTATTKIIEHTNDLIRETLNGAQKRLVEYAMNNPRGIVSVFEINEVFTEIGSSNTASVAKTKYQLDKFLLKNGNLILPEKIILDQIWTWVHNPSKHLVQKPIFFYYVPVFETLGQLLNQTDVLFCINNPPMFRGNGMIRNFTDGNLYQNHVVFKNHPNALIINLYYDDVEIVNPLGSKTKTHKMGMFYWSLGNIHPNLRSSIRAINLLAVVKTSFVRKYGVRSILSRFVDEIKILEEGKIFRVKGNDVLFHGSLFIFTGDTLAANYVGGFKEGVSFAHKPCRSCLGTQTSIKTTFQEETFTLRNKENHLEQCNDVEEPTLTKEAKQFWSRHHGINEKSVLCELSSFDVTHSLVHDLMHVVIEGAVQLECRLFIKYCVQEKKYFNLPYLNKKIMYFDYKHLKKDKPSIIETSHLENKLRQTCAQTITLANLLPFLIHGKVPENDEKLKNVILHLQILNVMMAFEISDEDITLLKCMIEEHHYAFKDLYPDEAIKPKMHYMVHMPRQIQEYGPLRHQWCMRYEGVHCRLRPLVTTMKNFKNIAYSLAYRFQSLRCSQLFQLPNTKDSKYLYQGDDIRPGPAVTLFHHNSCELIQAAFNISDANTMILNSKQVTVHGSTYKKGTVILVSNDEESLPTFGLIKEIFAYATKICFLYTELLTNHYEESLNAYKVTDTERYYVKKIEDLLHPFPLSMFSANQYSSSYFVILLSHRRNEFF